MWDYAKLSKAAKNVGGPEKLIDIIYSNGVNNGIKSMMPWLLAAGAAGALIYKEVDKVKKYLDEKKMESSYELEKAKRELVEGINEFDKNTNSNIDIDNKKISNE